MKKRHLKPSHSQFLVYYEQYADPLFRFCYHKTSDREVAKDITQDAFVRTWEYLIRGGEIDNMRAFLYRTANNMIVDHYRRHTMSSLNDLTEQGFDPVFENESDPTDRLDGAIAIKILDTMDPRHKEVILLRYVEELSIKEIAKIIEEKENTVSVRLHRALKELKDIYSNVGRKPGNPEKKNQKNESEN
ncbi:MAG: RNA polymerase sigma factor [Candidatus Pacebacteria bacterium]|nr:RNA polymerase sigma factor [Candidatus Paceibacterota bacterium]